MPRPNNVGVGVAIIVYDDAGDILLLERQGAHAARTFACPGGWIDPGDEEPTDACIRELWEEIGLIGIGSDDLFLLCAVKEWHEKIQTYSVTLYYCLRYCQRFHGKPEIREPEKCSKLEWFDKLPSKYFPKLDIAWKRFHETVQY